MTPKNWWYASVAGTVAVALCCFTPILVVALAAFGLGAFTDYLDVVLLPALAILIVVTWISYRRYVRTARP
jgi:mercuric ion transport protein